MGVVVLGSVFVDIKGYPFGNYIPGGRNAGRVQYVHGGVSRNIAEDLGNLGLQPVFLSLVDESGIGRDVIVRLREHQVNADHVLSVPGGMGTWLAVFDSNNDVCAAISQRPDLTPLTAVLRDRGDALFAAADSVLLELDMEPEILSEVFRLAALYGKKVYAAVSNISIAMERREFFHQLSCFVCNRSEAEILFSTEWTSDQPEELARQLAGLVAGAGVPSMVMTLGGDGAVWAAGDGLCGVTPALQVPVADTTGAGDAFFAGVAAGLTYGRSLPDACEIGSRLAASVIGSMDNTCPVFLPGEFGLKLP